MVLLSILSKNVVTTEVYKSCNHMECLQRWR